jgi:hypothetical protein
MPLVDFLDRSEWLVVKPDLGIETLETGCFRKKAKAQALNLSEEIGL